MEFTVTTKGPTFEDLTRDTARDLKQANRKAGRQLAKVGVAAMKKGAPRMFGKTLGVKADVDAWPSRCSVEFHPAARQSGAWQITEAGAGAHLIEPRRRRALRFDGRFAMAVHHPGTGGRGAWTKAGQRLAKAVDKTVKDVYDEALDA